jgi:hypothetical protein
VTSVHVGAELLLTATVTEFGRPLSNAQIQVEVRPPDGGVFTLDLKENASGRYATSTQALVPGQFSFHFRAKGKASRALAFTREALRTVHVWSAGQVPVDVGPVPRSEQGTTTPGTPGQGPTGGTGSGGGGTTPPKGSLDDLFDRYPALRRLLELCCGHRSHDHHHHCGPDCHHHRCGPDCHHHHHHGDHHHHGPDHYRPKR